MALLSVLVALKQCAGFTYLSLCGSVVCPSGFETVCWLYVVSLSLCGSVVCPIVALKQCAGFTYLSLSVALLSVLVALKQCAGFTYLSLSVALLPVLVALKQVCWLYVVSLSLCGSVVCPSGFETVCWLYVSLSLCGSVVCPSGFETVCWLYVVSLFHLHTHTISQVSDVCDGHIDQHHHSLYSRPLRDLARGGRTTCLTTSCGGRSSKPHMYTSMQIERRGVYHTDQHGACYYT